MMDSFAKPATSSAPEPSTTHHYPTVNYQDPTPKERLLAHGPEGLSDTELLSILTGHRLDAAGRVMDEVQSLPALLRYSPHELMRACTIGEAAAAQIAAAFELGRRATRQGLAAERIDEPEKVYDLLATEMQALRQESLRVILLNTRHRLMRVVNVSTGSVNESIADPREIFRPAIIHNAYAIVLVHNHPSGDPSPSESDRQMTRRIRELATMHRINLIDHVIIGRPSPDHPAYFSFRESGLL